MNLPESDDASSLLTGGLASLDSTPAGILEDYPEWSSELGSAVGFCNIDSRAVQLGQLENKDMLNGFQFC